MLTSVAMRRKIRRATNPKRGVPSRILPFLAVYIRHLGKPESELDAELRKIAEEDGGYDLGSGSGYDFTRDERDHSWHFEDGEMDKAETLAAKLRKVPGITLSVERIA